MILPNGQSVFLIIPDDDVTQSVVNMSTSYLKEDMPSKVSAGTTYRIVEVTTPIDSSLVIYAWYLPTQIQAAWEALP